MVDQSSKFTILVLSDIHGGNAHIRSIRDLVSDPMFRSKFNLSCNELWNLGDILDRGLDPPRVILGTLESFGLVTRHIHGNHDRYDEEAAYLAQARYIALSRTYRNEVREVPENADLRAFFDSIMDNHVVVHDELPRKAIGYHGGPVPVSSPLNPARIEGCWQRLSGKVPDLVAAIKHGDSSNPLARYVDREQVNEEMVFPSMTGGVYAPVIAFKQCRKILQSEPFISISGHNHKEQMFSYNFQMRKDTSSTLEFGTTIFDPKRRHRVRELVFDRNDSLVLSMRSSGGYRSDYAHAVVLELHDEPARDRVFFLDVMP